jgi:trk system potassium uptake protein
MNIRAVSNFVGLMLVVLGLAIAVCLAVSIYYGDPASAVRGLLLSCGIMIPSGALVTFLTRGGGMLRRRDGFGIVTFGWLFASLFGALPFYFSGVIPSYVAAVFETMSGFTTTGASVLSDLEQLPRGILLWRASTHLFGGMGVLILCVAILPLLGVGGMHIYRAELPGPSKDRLSPRIATTAKLLWGVYVLLCLIQILLLKIGGMNLFDSVCHTFATMATGGFSTRTASIGAFDSLYIEMVIVVFMILAGTNFALHYRALTGRPGVYFRDPEFRFYLGALLGAVAFMSLNLLISGYGSIGKSLRDALFTGTSILTTTGFCTADFDQWPIFSRLMLVAMMFVGGCAGSTGGGIKVMRVMVSIKTIFREIKLFMQPKSVIAIKIGDRSINPPEVSHISAFVMLFVLLFGFFTLIMCFFTPDIETAFSSVIATMGNIGPGLAGVGATRNYAEIPALGQAILTFCMLLGRLELYTVLIVLLPSFWNR